MAKKLERCTDKSRVRESNSRHSLYKSDALPTELTRRAPRGALAILLVAHLLAETDRRAWFQVIAPSKARTAPLIIRASFEAR